MAKNWTPSEVVEVICKGKDKASIADIGKRLPFFAMAIASINGASPAAGKVLFGILNSLPDYVTARQINSRLAGDEEGEGAETEVAEKPATKAPTKATSGKAKAKPVVEDDDDDDDEEPAPKAKAKAKAKPVVEEDDDEDEEPAPKAKAKAKAKPVVEEDDDDEDEEPAPKAKAKAKPAAKAKSKKSDDDDWDI